MQIDIIETTGLGDRSYLVSDGGVGVVIDPQRDIDRAKELHAEYKTRKKVAAAARTAGKHKR